MPRISVGGARLARKGGWNSADAFGVLTLALGLLRLPCKSVRINQNGNLAIQFIHDDTSRRGLIRMLFTGGYNNEVEKVNVIHTFIGAMRTLFR